MARAFPALARRACCGLDAYVAAWLDKAEHALVAQLRVSSIGRRTPRAVDAGCVACAPRGATSQYRHFTARQKAGGLVHEVVGMVLGFSSRIGIRGSGVKRQRR
jgi:hypothetical protein